MMLVGPALSMFGQISQASAQAQAANNAAKQSEMNARAEATDQRRKAQIVMAKQRAITGASGVQPVGSPLEAMLDSAKEAELEAQRTIWAGKQQAAMYRYQGSAYKASIPWTVLTGTTRAATSILGSLYGQP